MMKSVLLMALAILCLNVALTASGQNNLNPARDAFWSRFQSAVARGDKRAVASMTSFPLEMPYGVRSKSRGRFIRDYEKIFDAETRQCFAAARPEVDSPASKKFYIGCGEAMMYWFEPVNGQYKFTSVDNINE
jgi:hypothetical protein